MSSSSLESKTIRPGSLGAYSYYHSDRRPVPVESPRFISSSRHHLIPKKLFIIVGLLAAIVILPLLRGSVNSSKRVAASQVQPSKSSNTTSAPAVTATGTQAVNQCAGNSASKAVVVSINQRHMWACDGTAKVYDSPVITGMMAHASTLTPTGTYTIYGKQADTVLTGSDETGSWRDPVSYWMPFLNNQYGTYGFHDATWRDNSAFGHISPNSSDASHGCVELPLSTAKWLYNWAAVGTNVTVEN